MTEFPPDGEPSMVQAVELRRLRCKMHQANTMPKITSRPRTPEMEATATEKLFWGTASVGGLEYAGEALDEEEVLNDDEVLDEEVLDAEEVLGVEEVLDEDVAEDESRFILVYLHPKSVQEIGIINERTQTLERLRTHIVPHSQRILQAYVVYSPTPWSSR